MRVAVAQQVKLCHLRLDARAAEDVTAVDDDGLVHDLVADGAVELVGHREEPLAFRDLEVEKLFGFFGQALKRITFGNEKKALIVN